MLEEKPKHKPPESASHLIDYILIGSLIVAVIFAAGLVATALIPRLDAQHNNLYGAAESLQLGEVLVSETFDDSNAWEYYDDGDSFLRVEDGYYRMMTPKYGYLWGLNSSGHSDVIIEVTATQLSTERDNSYGVMCRADHSNNGDGYYFLISGDGFYSIRYAANDSETIDPLVDYTYSDIIQQGQATNHIRVACVGDYLALWVNDTLLAETYNSYFDGGLAGFVAAVTTQTPMTATDIVFDDLTITQASIKQ